MDAVVLARRRHDAQPPFMLATAPIRTISDVRALFANLADQPREVIGVAYLDDGWRVVGMRHSLSGSANAADLPLRQIARDAVAFGAVRVVMAHNHPSGDPTPSAADRCATRRLAGALAALGAPLVEHLVLAGSRWSRLGIV